MFNKISPIAKKETWRRARHRPLVPKAHVLASDENRQWLPQGGCFYLLEGGALNRRLAAQRSRYYGAILAKCGYSGVSAVDPITEGKSTVSALPTVEGVAYEDLDPNAKIIISVDRLCRPLRLRLPSCPEFVVPTQWIAAARAELGMCPGCVCGGTEVQRQCGHAYEQQFEASDNAALLKLAHPRTRKRGGHGRRARRAVERAQSAAS